MAQNWDIDPKTGDYKMIGGAPVQTNSLRVPAYVRLKTPQGGWLYAPDDNYGSRFYALKKRQTVGDASGVETIAANALSPIVNDGRASSVTVEAKVVARHGIGLETEIVDAGGEVENLILPGLGV